MTYRHDYLNFGAGDPVPGWLNLDASPLFRLPRPLHRFLMASRFSGRSPRYVAADYHYFRFVRGRPLPLEDSSVTAIYCSHVLEHLPAQIVPALLDEFRRITRPGGVVRIIVPDLAGMAERAFQSDGPFVALDEKLGTLPAAVSDSRLRSVLEGAFGFPSFHRTAFSLDALASALGPAWVLRKNLSFLNSGIASDRLAAVEEADRFEQALAFELHRQ